MVPQSNKKQTTTGGKKIGTGGKKIGTGGKETGKGCKEIWPGPRKHEQEAGNWYRRQRNRLSCSAQKVCIRTHSYCVDQRWGSEVARATACAGLLILKVAGVLGRAGGLPSGPILSGPSRTQRKKLHIFSPS
jgi:hypothetical protein